MYKNITFALLQEGATHLSDTSLPQVVQDAGAQEYSWHLHSGRAHPPGCEAARSRDKNFGSIVQGALAEYWDKRCGACPDPLRNALGKNLASLVIKAATLLAASRIDPGTASYLQTRLLQEALGGPVRAHPDSFSAELVSVVRENFEAAKVHLLENVGSVLAEHAAIRMAAPRVGNYLYSMPAPDGGVLPFYHQAAGHWRREKSGDISSALEAWREVSVGNHPQEQYGVGLYEVLDKRYQQFLADATPQTVAVPEEALQLLHEPLLVEAVRSTGKLVHGHYFVETFPVVAAWLETLGSWHAPVVNFGAANADDTDAVLETVVSLYADSRQQADNLEASALLEAARMLN